MDIHIGTLSKAIGSQGGFVACSRNIKSLLLNRGRPYVYSTALPLPTVAAASAAITVSEAVSHYASLPFESFPFTTLHWCLMSTSKRRPYCSNEQAMVGISSISQVAKLDKPHRHSCQSCQTNINLYFGARKAQGKREAVGRHRSTPKIAGALEEGAFVEPCPEAWHRIGCACRESNCPSNHWLRKGCTVSSRQAAPRGNARPCDSTTHCPINDVQVSFEKVSPKLRQEQR